MKQELSILIKRLNNPLLNENNVIPWSSPVLSFGNLPTAKIATIGLNPSNREFVDQKGKELEGLDRRFHTLNSLGLSKWSDVDHRHLDSILNLCFNYFQRNPYDSWFKKLDGIISGTSMSYYFPSGQACHLDLIPYATACKWTELSNDQRSTLLNFAADTLGLLLKNSSVKLVVLNGQTVVQNIEKISKCKFEKIHMPDWSLKRKGTDYVNGYAYKGVIHVLGGVQLKEPIAVLGYNHNIQSSYGVTKEVQSSIRTWVAESSQEVLGEA